MAANLFSFVLGLCKTQYPSSSSHLLLVYSRYHPSSKFSYVTKFSSRFKNRRNRETWNRITNFLAILDRSERRGRCISETRRATSLLIITDNSTRYSCTRNPSIVPSRRSRLLLLYIHMYARYNFNDRSPTCRRACPIGIDPATTGMKRCMPLIRFCPRSHIPWAKGMHTFISFFFLSFTSSNLQFSRRWASPRSIDRISLSYSSLNSVGLMIRRAVRIIRRRIFSVIDRCHGTRWHGGWRKIAGDSA